MHSSRVVRAVISNAARDFSGCSVLKQRAAFLLQVLRTGFCSTEVGSLSVTDLLFIADLHWCMTP